LTYSLETVYRVAQELEAQRRAEEEDAKLNDSAPVKVWQPPSFDPTPKQKVVRVPLPTVDEVEAIRAEAHRLGYDEGFNEGRDEGLNKGYEVGHEKGLEEGRAAGHAEAFEQAKARIDSLTANLNALVEAIEALPQEMAEPLHELAYSVAERLSAKEGIDRGPLVSAIQEALMRLPRPGETLFFRIHPKDRATWEEALGGSGLPFKCDIVIDENLTEGHAFVEASGTRLNIGEQARRAIVRGALGLDDAAGQPV
jgi:flagellar assembly protein FliH